MTSKMEETYDKERDFNHNDSADELILKLNETQKETDLQLRLAKLVKLEEDIKKREKVVKSKESAKKQVLLRLAPNLWEKISIWADEDYRSINGQIEYILHEAVKRHFK